MRDDEFGDSSRQMEQQGGTYRPEGDRGLDFEADHSGDFGMGQQEQQSGRQGQDDFDRSRQQGSSDRSRQQEQSDSNRSRRDSQQGEWDSEDEDI